MIRRGVAVAWRPGDLVAGSLRAYEVRPICSDVLANDTTRMPRCFTRFLSSKDDKPHYHCITCKQFRRPSNPSRRTTCPHFLASLRRRHRVQGRLIAQFVTTISRYKPAFESRSEPRRRTAEMRRKRCLCVLRVYEDVSPMCFFLLAAPEQF